MNRKGNLNVLFVFLVLIMFFYTIKYSTTITYKKVIIDEKWVKYQGDNAKYLVSDKEGEVFQITDNIIATRWNSSDLYAKLKSGMNCELKLQGWRLPFLSDYRNILSADCK